MRCLQVPPPPFLACTALQRDLMVELQAHASLQAQINAIADPAERARAQSKVVRLVGVVVAPLTDSLGLLVPVGLLLERCSMDAWTYCE